MTTTSPAEITIVDHETDPLSGNASKRDALWAEVDPPPPTHKGATKMLHALPFIIGLGLIFGLPFIEDQIRAASTWGYTASPYGFVNLYGLVIIFNLVLPFLVVQLYVAFGVVSAGRKKHGYKLPLMYASVDIHVEDVLAGGSVLSGGNAVLAKQKLDAAVSYSCHQRAHGNTMETFPMFLVLSAFGGVRYPIATAIHGFCWMVSRIIWTRRAATRHRTGACRPSRALALRPHLLCSRPDCRVQGLRDRHSDFEVWQPLRGVPLADSLWPRRQLPRLLLWPARRTLGSLKVGLAAHTPERCRARRCARPRRPGGVQTRRRAGSARACRGSEKCEEHPARGEERDMCVAGRSHHFE